MLRPGGHGEVAHQRYPEGGVPDSRPFASAVPQDVPGLHVRQRVFDPSSDPLVHGVQILLPLRKIDFFAWPAIRDDHRRVAQVGPSAVTCAPGLPVDARVPIGPAVVAAARRCVPTATFRRVLASMTTCMFTEYR